MTASDIVDVPGPSRMARGGEVPDISSTDHTCTLPCHRLIAVTAGNVVLTMADGADLTLTVPNNTDLKDVVFTKVVKVGTTATGLTVLW